MLSSVSEGNERLGESFGQSLRRSGEGGRIKRIKIDYQEKKLSSLVPLFFSFPPPSPFFHWLIRVLYAYLSPFLPAFPFSSPLPPLPPPMMHKDEPLPHPVRYLSSSPSQTHPSLVFRHVVMNPQKRQLFGSALSSLAAGLLALPAQSRCDASVIMSYC